MYSNVRAPTRSAVYVCCVCVGIPVIGRGLVANHFTNTSINSRKWSLHCCFCSKNVCKAIGIVYYDNSTWNFTSQIQKESEEIYSIFTDHVLNTREGNVFTRVYLFTGGVPCLGRVSWPGDPIPRLDLAQREGVPWAGDSTPPPGARSDMRGPLDEFLVAPSLPPTRVSSMIRTEGRGRNVNERLSSCIL